MQRSVLFLLFSFVLALTACSADAPSIAPTADQIVRLSDSEAKGLDPQHVTDIASLRIAADQFEGLTQFNAMGEAEPAIALEWTISTDGLRWVFKIAQDRSFSDGTAIKAGSFEDSFKRLFSQDAKSPHVALFSMIENIEANSEYVVTVSLNSPFPNLPDLLAHPALAALPHHKIEADGDRWTSERPVVTSGAYQLVTWKLNDHIRLERNPHWPDAKNITSNIIWKSMDNSLSALRLMLSGGADTASDYPASRHKWLKRNHADMARSSPYLGAYYFAFNTRKPPFDDARVRRALSMAIDREWIAGVMMANGNDPAWGIIPDKLSELEAYRPKWADWSKSKRAKVASELLTSAGYNKANPLRFEMRFNSSSEHRRVAVAMASIWRSLGVEASLFNSEAALHFASLRRRDFSLARSGWIADVPAPENFLAVHHSDAGARNYSGYESKIFDEALDHALTISDPLQRAKAMRQAEAILVTDMPIIPIYFYVTRSLVSPRIAGWKDNITNVHPSRTLSIREK